MKKLERNTYEVPERLKIEAAWRETWAAWLGMIPFVGGSVWVVIHNGIAGEGTWAVLGVSALAMCIVLYGLIREYINGPIVTDVNGLTVVYTSRDYYIPSKVMEPFVEEHTCAPFRPHIEEEPWDLLEGKVVLVEDIDLQWKGIDAWGMTYPWSGYSQVEGPMALHPGVMGWELKLQIMQELFPGSPEKLDIMWLRSKGI